MKSALQTTAAVMSLLAGLAGLEHGIGEILQGSTAPAGLVIESWPDAAFFEILGGEPAMTVLPNLLWSGVLTVLVSLVFIAWGQTGLHQPGGGLVLILISLVLLAVGGGFGPPLLGLILGVAALGARAGAGADTGLRRLWRRLLAACLLAWLALFPGLGLAAVFFHLEDAALAAGVVLLAFGLLLATLLAAYGCDHPRSPRLRPA